MNMDFNDLKEFDHIQVFYDPKSTVILPSSMVLL